MALDPITKQLAKAHLVTWAKSDGAQLPLLGYGTKPEDMLSTWTVRDSAALAQFSIWWNVKGFLPQLPITDLTWSHALALNVWAAGNVVKPGDSFPAPPGWPSSFPWPPLIPWNFEYWWPATAPWPPIGPDKPPGWPSNSPWPPTLPPGVLPAGMTWPLPIPTIPGAPGTLPTELPTEAKGTLPPPTEPKTSPPASEVSTPSDRGGGGTFLLVGGLVVGGLLLFALAGGGGGALLANPKVQRRQSLLSNPMTKKQAVEEFREYYLPGVIEQYGRDDKPAIAEAWNNFTDMLQKEGQITSHQYSTWVHPF